MQIYLYFFLEFPAVPDRCANLGAGNIRTNRQSQKQQVTAGNKAELKLLVGDVILLGIQSRINRRNRHSAWDTPASILYRAGPRRL